MMPRHHFPFSIFLLTALLFGCKGSADSTTEILPQKQVVSIMVDMHLAETAANMKLTETDSLRPSYKQLCDAIFEKHGTSRAVFDSTLYYLSFQPKEMNTVYDLVLERLSEMDAEAAARVSQATAAELDAMNAHKR